VDSGAASAGTVRSTRALPSLWPLRQTYAIVPVVVLVAGVKVWQGKARKGDCSLDDYSSGPRAASHAALQHAAIVICNLFHFVLRSQTSDLGVT
jgi:hypothetical protein